MMFPDEYLAQLGERLTRAKAQFDRECRMSVTLDRLSVSIVDGGFMLELIPAPDEQQPKPRTAKRN